MALQDTKITDLTEKATSGQDSWLHFVDPTDVSQSPEGSSYKISKINYLKEIAADVIKSAPFLGSIIPTSTPTGTGIAYWLATQNGTYNNFGGVVVNTNSLAVISRSAAGVFSISQTALNLASYATLDYVNTKDITSIGNTMFSAGTELVPNIIRNQYWSFNLNIVSTASNFIRTPIFRIEPSKTYTYIGHQYATGNNRSYWLDKNLAIIDAILPSTEFTTATIVSPSNAYYVCLSSGNVSTISLKCAETITVKSANYYIQQDVQTLFTANQNIINEFTAANVVSDEKILTLQTEIDSLKNEVYGGDFIIANTNLALGKVVASSYYTFGVAILSNAFYSRALVRIEPLKSYKFIGNIVSGSMGNSRSYWLDKNQNEISAMILNNETFTEKDFTAPDGAFYAAITTLGASLQWKNNVDIVIKDEYNGDVIFNLNKIQSSPLYQKRIAFFGDSLMSGLEYNDITTPANNIIAGIPARLNAKYDITTSFNESEGGTTIQSVFIGIGQPKVDANGYLSTSIGYKMAHFGQDVDYIIFTGGFNDAYRNYNGYTEYSSGTVSADYTTGKNIYSVSACNALETAFYHLKTTYPNTKIVWLKCWGGGIIAAKPTLDSFYSRIEEVCEKWAVPVCDLYKKSNLNLLITAQQNLYGRKNVTNGVISRDNIHLSTAGYDRVFDYVDNFLNTEV